MQRWKIKKPKTKCALTLNMNEKYGSSLDFIIIMLSSPVVDKNWVSQHIVCCTVHLQKMMPCTMFQSNKTFCEGQIHWMFPLSHSMALVFDACVRQVSLVSCDIANTTCVQEHLLYEPDFRGCALYIFRSTQCILLLLEKNVLKKNV